MAASSPVIPILTLVFRIIITMLFPVDLVVSCPNLAGLSMDSHLLILRFRIYKNKKVKGSLSPDFSGLICTFAAGV
jgi:hypothetical protein